MASHITIQLAIWTAFTEFGQPLVRIVLSVLPFWSNFENTKTSSGKLVWDYAPMTCAIALWRCAGALAAVCGHVGGVAELFRLGIAIECAYRLNDFVVGALGVLRYSGRPWQVRGMMLLYNLFGMVLAVPAGVVYSDQRDVRQLAVYLMCSGASLAAVVPLQYMVNPTTLQGSKLLFALQLVNLFVFVVLRLFIGVYGQSSLHARVLTRLYSSDPMHAYVAGVGILTMCYFYSSVVVVLLFQRLRLTWTAMRSKVKLLHKYFNSQGKSSTPKEIHDYIWSSVKFSDIVVGVPADMMSLGAWCGMRKKMAGKAA